MNSSLSLRRTLPTLGGIVVAGVAVVMYGMYGVTGAVANPKEPASGVTIDSDFGRGTGTGDVVVVQAPNVSARVYRTALGTTVVFENGSLHGPQAVDRSGRYRIAIDGRTVFDGEMTLLPYGRSKHGPFRADGKPPPLPAMTDEVRRRSGLNIGVPIPESVLAGLPASFPKKVTGAVGTVPAYMGTTGANPNIGIVPAHAARALSSGDPRAIANTLAEADVFFTWPVHYRDEKTGRPLVYTDHPYASISSSDHGVQILGTGQKVYQPDTAHQPHALFVAYLLTGEPYYLDEMLQWDAWNYLFGTDTGRLNALSLVRNDSGYQTRAAAWVLVARGQLLSVLPKDHPSRAALIASLEANAAVYRARFVDGTYDESKLLYSPYATGGARNQLGLFCSDPSYGTAADGSVMTSGWMNAFMVQMWAYLVTLDLPLSARGKADLEAVMRFGFRYEKRLGRNGGWDVRRMGAYGFPAGVMVDGRIRWYADHKETWKHQVAPLPPLPPATGAMYIHDSNTPLGSLNGFEANEWPAIAFAKMYGDDDGAFEAIVANETFRRLGPALEPQWAIFPPGLSMAKVLAKPAR